MESLFLLYRVTGNPLFQDLGWDIFLALEKYCKTPSSYSGLVDVRETANKEKNWNNSMQSFFFAETLKYLFLLFSPKDVLPLDKFVFNTEGTYGIALAQPLFLKPLTR